MGYVSILTGEQHTDRSLPSICLTQWETIDIQDLTSGRTKGRRPYRSGTQLLHGHLLIVQVWLKWNYGKWVQLMAAGGKKKGTEVGGQQAESG